MFILSFGTTSIITFNKTGLPVKTFKGIFTVSFDSGVERGAKPDNVDYPYQK
jgi:hypothetical protein